MDNLVQFEEDFNSGTKKLRWSSPGSGCYLRPVQFLDHLTVIKSGVKKYLEIMNIRGGSTLNGENHIKFPF